MKSISMSRSAGCPADFTLAVRVVPGDTFEWSKVLLARAHFNGTFELLTSAWEKLLGYGRQEFAGKTLRQLMPPRKAAATAAIAAILDERDLAPVELSLRCRNGEGKCLTLHRRFDPDERTMFIVAEERLLP
jgi:PAS domain S-box-containing protein